MVRALRVASAAALGAVVLACLAGAIGVAQLSTAGLYRRLGGITLGDEGGHVRIVRHHLDCAPVDADMREACRVSIDGDPLDVAVVHHPTRHWSFSECLASYRGQTFLCREATYTVTGPPHAAIAGLPLSGATLEALRRQHALTSMWEAGWKDLAGRVAVVLAAAVVLVVVTRVAGAPVRRVVLTAASGAGAYAVAYAALMVFLLATDFVD